MDPMAGRMAAPKAKAVAGPPVKVMVAPKAPTPPPRPNAPSQPMPRPKAAAPSSKPSPLAPPPTAGPMQPAGQDSYQQAMQAMQAYMVGGVNLTVKGCLEGEGAVCTLLQKGCDLASSNGRRGSADEQLLCASVSTVCPQQLDGFDIAASICLQKSVHVCDAAQQICDTISGGDAVKSAACVQNFQQMCPQIGKGPFGSR